MSVYLSVAPPDGFPRWSEMPYSSNFSWPKTRIKSRPGPARICWTAQANMSTYLWALAFAAEPRRPIPISMDFCDAIRRWMKSTK